MSKSLTDILSKLPEWERKALESDEMLKKIAVIVAQNQIILKKIAEKLKIEV